MNPAFILVVALFLALTAPARAAVVSFEESEGYNNLNNKTVIDLPSPGTDAEWNGPWVKSSGNNNRAVSSEDVAFHGTRSLRLGNNQIEIARDVDGGINGGNPNHRVEVYAYVTQEAIDNHAQAKFFVSTASNKFDESAGFRTGFSNTDNRMNWFVWDNGTYFDSGVAVATNTWVRLRVEMNMLDRTYVAQVDDTYLLPNQTLDFGSGSGGNSPSSNITTGVGFSRDNSDGYVYFDAVGLYPTVPEVPAPLIFGGVLVAGMLPTLIRRLRGPAND